MICEKNGIKFEVEILRLPDNEICHTIKFKKLEGSATNFREICKMILTKINNM